MEKRNSEPAEKPENTATEDVPETDVFPDSYGQQIDDENPMGSITDLGPSAKDVDMQNMHKKAGAATATQSDFRVADGKRARTLRIAESAKKSAADVPVPVSNQFQALEDSADLDC